MDEWENRYVINQISKILLVDLGAGYWETAVHCIIFIHWSATQQ